VPVLLFWRCVFGALSLAVFCAALRLWRPMAVRTLGLAAAGGVAIVTNWLLLFESYRHASISIATAVYNTQPFMLVGLSALMLRERVSALRMGLLLLAFGGVLLVAQAKPAAAPPDAHYGLGIALALGAALLYAVAAFITKKLTGTPPHLIALVQVTVGAVILAPWALRQGLPAGGRAWVPLVTLGVLYTGVMYILLYGALQKLPTVLAGALSFIYPVVAMLVDHLAFNVRLGAAQWAGAAAILLAAAGLSLADAWPRYRRSLPP
jgi:drug/metabolite transporter (DMT)-like permease